MKKKLHIPRRTLSGMGMSVTAAVRKKGTITLQGTHKFYIYIYSIALFVFGTFVEITQSSRNFM